ncbi:glycosyltransferase family 2 protein [Actinospongicola halichondriae]|uniref:glycosyltransferase family 2 protein n=1 Tax=Actinospongicola halichondriae TaxID=3236844 RepID=UPI003D3FAB4E
MSVAVSVVVSTYDRPEMMERLLDSLLAQDHPDHEIIVVDNGSDARTGEMLDRVAEHDHRSVLRRLRVDVNRGPAPARNLGWRAADAPLIAFIDDDCIAEPTWLSGLCAEAAPKVIVQGRTTPDGDLRASGAWAKSQNINRVTMRFETCNLLMPRDVLEATDGFDERFRVAAGEDTDLGWRAMDLGVQVVFAPEARVRHVIWDRTFRDHLRERIRWSETALVVKKHPGIRTQLPLRFLYRWAHGIVMVGVPVAAILLLTPLWWLVPVGLAAWVAAYVGLRGRRFGILGAARRSVETLISAVWEVALFARSSLRFRTLLL